MLNLTDSDVFKLQDSSGILSKKIQAVLQKGMTGQTGKDIIILNNDLADSIQNMKRLYNEPIVLNIMKAIQSGDLLLVNLSIEYSIPKCLPFIRFRASNNKTKVMVNLTPYVDVKKDSLGKEVYSISAQKLYPILISAYLTLSKFDERYMLPANALSSSAYIWAAMFNKILCKTVALGTNRDRYDAFMYFAMKFFCIYIVQTPDQIAENVARGYLTKKGLKNFPMLDNMLQKIDERNINIYESFTTFCRALFNNEITNLRVNSSERASHDINVTMFINRFVDQYTYTALMSLASYPYFLFAVLNTALKTRVVNDLAFQDIITDKDYSAIKLLNAVISI